MVDDGATYFLAVAEHSNVYVVDGTGLSTDVTPASLVSGSDAPANNKGYGGGFYGFCLRDAQTD